MPDFIVTLHAYGTWMPDRPQGFFHWKRGYQERDDELADSYRRRQSESSAFFDETVQRALIEAVLESATFRSLTIHAVATDDAHVHVLCAWEDGRPADTVRERLKYALTRRLNERIHRRTWFAKGGHEKQVADEGHGRYLREEYLPSHRGLRWDAQSGWAGPGSPQ